MRKLGEIADVPASAIMAVVNKGASNRKNCDASRDLKVR
jgi:hypothetical protein